MKFPLKSVKLRRKDELGSVHPSPENFENTAYWPGFFSAKQLGVFLLLPGWDNSPIPIYTLCGERHCEDKDGVFPKNTTHCPRPVLEGRPLDLDTSALAKRSPCLLNPSWCAGPGCSKDG